MNPPYIILFDGTDAFEATKTNISEIKDILQENIPRDNIKYFPGTNNRAASQLTNKIQRVFSTEIHRDVSEAIAWMENKEHGELYVFGYSRGAIAARYFSQCITNKKFTNQYGIDPPNTVRNVEYLALFDPVYGPLNFLARPPDHETQAVHNPRIKTYVEVNALSEHRFIMRLRSGKKAYYKWVKSRASNDELSSSKRAKSRADITAPSYYRDREKSGAISAYNPLENTGRYFNFMVGGHADVGGQNGCDVIASRSLLTVLLTALEMNQSLRNFMPSKRLDDLIHFTDSAGEPTPNKSLTSFRKVWRLLTGFGFEYFRRRSFNKL